MLSYILEVSLCWAVFYGLYWLWLSRETFFHFNRWYLLSTLILGVAIPWVEWQWLFAQPEVMTIYLQPLTFGVQTLEVTVTAAAVTPKISFFDVLRYIYFTGFLFCTIRLVIGVTQIARLYFKSERPNFKGFQLIHTDQAHQPFSFFRLLFLSKNIELDVEDRAQIMRHELAHIRGWHSVDVLLTEILTAIFWCSPLIYFYRRSLRTVHEYIADASVLRTTQRKQYGHLLIRQSQSGPALAIANHFHSQLKKRILMMLQPKSSRWHLAKYLLALPLLAVLIMAFAKKEELIMFPMAEANEMKAVPANTMETETPADTLPINKEVKITLTEEAKLDENVTYEIHYADGKVETLTDVTETDIGKIVNPGDISKIDVYKQPNALIKIWMKGSRVDETTSSIILPKSDRFGSRSFLIYHADGRIEKLPAGIDIYKYVKEENIAKQTVEYYENVVKIWLKGSEVTEFESQVDEIALFSGCDDEPNAKARQACSTDKLMRFIATNLNYPKQAREKGTTGYVIARISINKEGKVAMVSLLDGIGKECDEEVKRVLSMLPKWIPALKNGKPVGMDLTIPVQFKLQGEAKQFESERQMVYDTETRDLKLAQENEVVVVGLKPQEENHKVYTFVEEQPQFPDGTAALFKWIASNLKYPKEAREKGIEGTSYLGFVVEKDGSVTNVEVKRGIPNGKILDEEALRVAKMMPKWTPGRQQGENVRVLFTLPIKFKLDNAAANATPNVKIGERTLVLENFKVSPNPTTGIVNLRFKASNKPTFITVYDLQGKEILSTKVNDGNFNSQLDLSNAPKGTLILSIRQAEKVFTEQIILQ